MIRILIADDSPTDATILKSLFDAEPDMTVVAVATDGNLAVSMCEQLKPDIITMDIKMPKMDGYEAIDLIMRASPTPIVVISSMISDSESEATFRALEAGALTVLPKPIHIQSPVFAIIKRHMLDTIRSMSEIKVIRKRSLSVPSSTSAMTSYTVPVHGQYEMIAVGASVGGPQTLKEILERLPSNFSMPIVAVQHMSSGFIMGFSKWLDSHVALNVKYAEHDEILQPGTVYFAPDSLHFEIKRTGSVLRASLRQGEVVSGFCPSITVLMQSVSHVCGKNAVGVLLTGMGSDGAEGMMTLKQGGAHTIIQDADSCVVFGMASVAQAMGAVDRVVKLDKIAEYLIRITNKKSDHK